MSQTDNFITIGKSFAELRRASKQICQEKGASEQAQYEICRIYDKAEVEAMAKAQHEKTGKKLPGELKRELARRFHWSEKKIESIVYNYLGE